MALVDAKNFQLKLTAIITWSKLSGFPVFLQLWIYFLLITIFGLLSQKMSRGPFLERPGKLTGPGPGSRKTR